MNLSISLPYNVQQIPSIHAKTVTNYILKNLSVEIIVRYKTLNKTTTFCLIFLQSKKSNKTIHIILTEPTNTTYY